MKRIWKFKYDMYDIQSWLYQQWENPKIPTFNSSDRVALKTTTTTISLKSGTYPLVILTICFLYWVKKIRCNICVELHISLNKHATVVIFLSLLTARQWIHAFPKCKTFTVFYPLRWKCFISQSIEYLQVLVYFWWAFSEILWRKSHCECGSDFGHVRCFLAACFSLTPYRSDHVEVQSSSFWLSS